MVELIEAAMRASPTLSTARVRIEQARAAQVAAHAALVPTVSAEAIFERGETTNGLPLSSAALGGFQAAWEIDLFGGRRAARDAASWRLEDAEAGLRGARIAVAAELATSYISLRACQALVVLRQRYTASRAQTEQLTTLAVRSGFEPIASIELARASNAQSREVLRQQEQSCELLVKALVALTAEPEMALRDRLRPGNAELPSTLGLLVPAVPAAAIEQRPDVAQAGWRVAAASADVTGSEADRYPRVSLTGMLGVGHIDWGSGSQHGVIWTLGPLTVTMPVFDGGLRRANVVAAKAHYDAATALYAETLRNAVREVEGALVTLQATLERQQDAQAAAAGYAASMNSAQERYRGGFSSLIELEDVRRSALQADIAVIELRRERATAWIALYRALGGNPAQDAAALPAPGASGKSVIVGGSPG